MDDIKPGYTRVTEILGQWNTDIQVDGETIAKAFAGSRNAIDISVLSNKANIGTNVHRAIEGYLEGFEVKLEEKEQGYFQSFLGWYAKSKVNIVESEKRYYCDKLGITGCVDALVRFPDSDDLILVDYKTSAQENPKMWPLQATFYHYLVSETGLKISDRLLFLKLEKKGFPASVFEYKFTPKLLQICKCACTCYRYINS